MKWLMLAFLLVLGACADRTYMTRGHGKAFRETLARQSVNPRAEGRETSKGLDTQEAAVIAQGYRTSLAHKDQEVTQQPALLQVVPSTGGNDGQQPAPLPAEAR